MLAQLMDERAAAMRENFNENREVLARTFDERIGSLQSLIAENQSALERILDERAQYGESLGAGRDALKRHWASMSARSRNAQAACKPF